MSTKQHAETQDRPARTEQGRGARAGKGPRGRGSVRDVPLGIDPRIDLTEPIYEQVLALLCCMGRGSGRTGPYPVWGQAMRT